VPRRGKLVDLGSGGRRLSPDTICVDFIPFASTGVVADVHHLPFRSESVDAVFATGLLEHVADSERVIAEMARIVRPGGLIHIEVPFLQQYHEDPIDYRRYTVTGLRHHVSRVGLVPLESGFHIGPTVAIITLLAYYVAMWFNGHTLVHKTLSTAVFAAFSTVAWPFKYLDVLARRCSDAHRLCFGVYCTAAKPDTPGGQAA
jgi:SAM-dependent methyltransferase